MTTPDQQNNVWQALGNLQGEMAGVQKHVGAVESNVGDLRAEVGELRKEMAAGFKEMRREIRKRDRRDGLPGQVLAAIGIVGGGGIAGAAFALLKLMDAL